MALRRKTITISVTLSVKAGITKAEAKREVRSLVNDECGYHSSWSMGDYASGGDVRIRSIR